MILQQFVITFHRDDRGSTDRSPAAARRCLDRRSTFAMSASDSCPQAETRWSRLSGARGCVPRRSGIRKSVQSGLLRWLVMGGCSARFRWRRSVAEINSGDLEICTRWRRSVACSVWCIRLGAPALIVRGSHRSTGTATSSLEEATRVQVLPRAREHAGEATPRTRENARGRERTRQHVRERGVRERGASRT